MIKFGIIGAGHIAERLADTMAFLRKEEIEPYAVASRDASKAAEFAAKHGCRKSYGSYEELVSDPHVDVVYVATPNTFHYPHSMLALEHGKPVLCEKPFTATFEEAELLFAEASRRKLFISEAMWTRCIPSVEKIREVIDSGEIGVVRTVTGVFGRHLAHVPRVARPELAGGGLLDLGIYPLNFAMMFLGEDYTSAKSFITLTPEGVDAQAVIVLEYADGRVANVMSSMTSDMGEPGAVCGTEGQIRIQSMLKSQSFTLERRGVPQHEFDCSFDFNGYEYMLRSVAKAVSENRYECPEMKHESTLMAMKVMDDARRNGRVVRPGPEY